MKLIITAFILTSFTANAHPLLSMKERVRLHLWAYGLEESKEQPNKKVPKPLPEELERALKKI